MVVRRLLGLLSVAEHDTDHDQPHRGREPDRDIAHDLTLNLKTVRNHVSNIFAELQVADRAAAIVKARDAGYGGHPVEHH